MKMHDFYDSRGNRVQLGKELASGGEGTVFEVADNNQLAAKIYKDAPSHRTVHKLNLMIARANPKLQAFAAWPVALLLKSGTAQVAGFLMPRIIDSRPIQSLYNPIQRLKCFSRACWDFQVRTATNLASAFEEVHRSGCLVADVNQSNILVGSNAVVRIIDCDSFQLTANGDTYTCDVGVSHYLAPELQGRQLRGFVRTENHDCFGLAVLIYQLLFVGRHPYAGVYHGSDDPSFEQLIKEYRFAQGPLASSWCMSPPPFTPLLSDVSADVGSLFRRAFERGGELNSRPRPADWISALRSFEKSLARCDSDPGHRFWHGAGGCVWCKIEKSGGPEYFFGVAGGLHKFNVDEKKLQDVLRRLEAVELFDFFYNRDEITKLGVAPVGRPPAEWLIQLRTEYDNSRLELSRTERRFCEAEKKMHAIAEQKRERLQADCNRRVQKIDAMIEEVLHIVAPVIQRRRRFSLALFSISLVAWCIGLVTFRFASCGIVVSFVIYLIGDRNADQRRLMRLKAERREIELSAQSQIRSLSARYDRVRLRGLQRREQVLDQQRQRIDAMRQKMKSAVSEEIAKRRASLKDAKLRFANAENRINQQISDYRAAKKNTSQQVHGLVSQIRSLSNQFDAEVSTLLRDSEIAARDRHLRLHVIADAEIPHIGVNRKKVLALSGIRTAFDIEESRVASLSGFGYMLTSILLSWKENVLGTFQFDRSAAISSPQLAAISRKYSGFQHVFFKESWGAIGRLIVEKDKFSGEVSALVTELREAYRAVRQAEADVEVFDG